MSFIQNSLSTGEEIDTIFELHWINTLPIYFYLLLAVPTLGLALIAAFIHWLRLRKTEIAVTNKRVIRKTGILSRLTVGGEMQLTSIENVALDQRTLGFFLGYGTVIVTGRGVSDVKLANVKNPLRVKTTIEGVVPYRNEPTLPTAAHASARPNKAVA